MRALRRIATPASVAVAIGGCTYPFDDYLPQKTDAGLSTNAKPDTAPEPDTSPPLDSGVFETLADTTIDEDTEPADTYAADTYVEEDTANDAPADTCACVKYTGGKCREWSPPGCGGS
jgi:hypothetical protein